MAFLEMLQEQCFCNYISIGYESEEQADFDSNLQY